MKSCSFFAEACVHADETEKRSFIEGTVGVARYTKPYLTQAWE